MNIVFMGTPDYASEILSEIIKHFNIIAVFTQPDKKVGRKQILTPPEVKKLLLSKHPNIKIYQPTTLKDELITNEIKSLKPDFIVVAAYGQILPQSILDIAPCINLHASLLPKYRGASPIQQSILDDELYGGVTAMLMDKGLDTGKMLGFSYVKINEQTNAQELFNKLAKSAARLTIKTIQNFDSICPLAQNNAQSSYAPKITKQNSILSFSQSSKQIWLKFKAYSPWPGICLENGLKLISLKMLKENEKFEDFGRILDINESFVEISCKQGSIALYEVNQPSKKTILAKDFLKGQRKKVGDYLL